MPDIDRRPEIGAQLEFTFTSVSVSVTCTPEAVVVEEMKLERMSERTTPLTVSTLEVAPADVLVPSAG
jgi:hypothetical protein